MIDLRKHNQVVELYSGEADALCHSIRLYLQVLVYHSSQRPLYRQELFSIKPLTRVHKQLSKMQLSRWPLSKVHRPKPRKWRLEVEELVLLNRLMVDSELFPVQDEHESYFNAIYGRINQKALNLVQFFEL